MARENSVAVSRAEAKWRRERDKSERASVSKQWGKWQDAEEAQPACSGAQHNVAAAGHAASTQISHALVTEVFLGMGKKKKAYVEKTAGTDQRNEVKC